MFHSISKIVDGMDFETFIRAQNESEAKSIMINIIEKFGFKDIDIVFVEWKGSGARVRARAYIHRAGDNYAWLQNDKGA